MRTRTLTMMVAAVMAIICAEAQNNVVLFKYGNFNTWVTREIKESKILGGNVVNVYEIGPERTIVGSEPYTPLGGSPWGCSNVLAKPAGITKCSNSVYPEPHAGNGLCAKLVTEIESCKALGIVNINVLAAGSVFLGYMIEPIKSTKNPYSHMEMGVPFTQRPIAIQYDYKVEVPAEGTIVYCPGFGKMKESAGLDQAEVIVFLQRRWEDENGNIYAKRVGTGAERFARTTDWNEGHRTPIMYGDITGNRDFKPYMGLIPQAKSYYARNSKGRMVPVQEVGWDEPDATPTHIVLMFSSSSGNAYEGTPGLTLWIDNVGAVY